VCCVLCVVCCVLGWLLGVVLGGPATAAARRPGVGRYWHRPEVEVEAEVEAGVGRD
jgi:hypothetical protein